MLQAEFKLHFSYEQQGFSVQPHKVSEHLICTLENLWLTILDILFYCIYDSSKSNNAVYVPYIFLCMSQSSHVSSIPQTCRPERSRDRRKNNQKSSLRVVQDYHKQGDCSFSPNTRIQIEFSPLGLQREDKGKVLFMHNAGVPQRERKRVREVDHGEWRGCGRRRVVVWRSDLWSTIGVGEVQMEKSLTSGVRRCIWGCVWKCVCECMSSVRFLYTMKVVVCGWCQTLFLVEFPSETL